MRKLAVSIFITLAVSACGDSDSRPPSTSIDGGAGGASGGGLPDGGSGGGTTPTHTPLHVAPLGSGDDCSAAHPCSLSRAEQAARTVKQLVDSDVVVFLHGGTYTTDVPLRLSPEDSGLGGHAIVYAAAPGELPVLSGGAVVSGWTVYDPAQNVWRAPVAPDLGGRQLYVNGVRAVRARGPSLPALQKRATGFWSADGSIAAFANASAIELVGYQQWKMFRCPVQGVRQGLATTVALSTGAGFAGPVEWLPDASQGVPSYVGDFDANGAADLVFAYDDGVHFRNAVALSTGGSFTWSGDWLTDAGMGIQYRIGDFNGDGRSDILFPYDDGAHYHNSVALSTGSSFAWSGGGDWLTDVGMGAEYAIGDFNGDGRSDILLAYQDGATFRNAVALSTGSSFAWSGDWLSDAGMGIPHRVGDFNGDGLSDLLLAYDDGLHVHNAVVLSTGSSFTWSGGGDWLTDAGGGAEYQIGDFNADGRSDVLFAYDDGLHYHNAVALSTGTSFTWAGGGDWLTDVGGGAQYQVGNFDGALGTDLLLQAPGHAFLDVQEPCWSSSQSHAGFTFDTVQWVENAHELLDEPGEWYLDQSEHMIYYQPRPGEDLSAAEVIVPAKEELVQVAGELDAGGHPRFVSDIRFEGLTFAYSTWLAPSTSVGYAEVQAGWHLEAGVLVRTKGGVTVSRAERVRFERCVFTHLGSAGISIDGGPRDVAIVGNRFADISSTAVQLGDVTDATATDDELKTTRNVISNNYIVACGREFQSAVGIFVGYGDSTVVEHNELEQLPYTGISIGWGWGQDSYAGHNVIEANHIHQVVQVLRDGGGIYTLSAQPGSVLRGNYLHDVGNTPTSQFNFAGIYHDEGTRFYSDTGNVVAGVEFWLQMWIETIQDNTLTANWVDYDRTFCNHVAGDSATCNFGSNSVTGNVFTAGAWPAEAQAVMDAAGLEPAYQDIKP
jgi:hypothetical protein